MQYSIQLKKKPFTEDYHEDWYWFDDYMLPGIQVPVRVEPMLTIDWVEKNYPEWCSHCDMDWRCHPHNEHGKKYCTILFHDAVKPKWELEEVV